MSTTTATVRAASRATPVKSESWWQSIKNESLSFFKGDNNAPWAILAETVIGCIPIVGQVVDARDIIKGLVEVSGAPANPMAWFNLITAIIGLVPGGGDAVKRSLRAVKSGTANVDDLLAMIRRFYSGDPEQLLKKILDVSVLRKKLDEILANPTLLKQLSPEMRRQIDTIRQGMIKQFDNFKKEVDGWLAQGRKTSSHTDSTRHSKGRGSPEVKPKSTTQEGKRPKEKQDQFNSAHAKQPNTATQRTARFKQLGNKLQGVMGEHMADYYCQNTKGWGKKALHDTAKVNVAKLNDNGRMVQLWPCVPRGRGIDAVWKTSNSIKPYAIIEAKTSFNPAKSIGALLGDARDKNKDEEGAQSSSVKGRKSRSGKKGSTSSSTSTRQTNGKVTQMGHDWIQRRLRYIELTDPAAHASLVTNKDKVYERKVLFFSIPQAQAHAEALILHLADNHVASTMHGAHEITREWTDAAIDKIVDNRSGLVGKNRKPK